MERLDLSVEITPAGPHEELLEALLPSPGAHREGDDARAQALLSSAPEVARANIWLAAATGEADTLRELLSADPSMAELPGGTRHWEPLLYLCFSRLLRLDLERAARMVECARLLLAAGADPNVHWIDPAEAEGNRETPLYGAAGIAGNVDVTKLLMAHGADPNDGETAYHMVEHSGVPCAGAIWPALQPLHRGMALGHLLDYDDLEGLRTLLELGADPNGPTPFPNDPLHQAVFRGRDLPFFDLLLDHGADIDRPNRHGRTAYALAARTGRRRIAEFLASHGADTQLAPGDAFLAAAAIGDLARARDLLRAEPGLLANMSSADRAQICEVADAGATEGVRAMLDLGWPVNARGRIWGETPLHRAAMQGHLETSRLLLERGADLTIRDRSYDASPLDWARHGGHDAIAALLAADPERLDERDRASLDA